jgi:hypothetical protein
MLPNTLRVSAPTRPDPIWLPPDMAPPAPCAMPASMAQLQRAPSKPATTAAVAQQPRNAEVTVPPGVNPRLVEMLLNDRLVTAGQPAQGAETVEHVEARRPRNGCLDLLRGGLAVATQSHNLANVAKALSAALLGAGAVLTAHPAHGRATGPVLMAGGALGVAGASVVTVATDHQNATHKTCLQLGTVVSASLLGAGVALIEQDSASATGIALTAVGGFATATGPIWGPELSKSCLKLFENLNPRYQGRQNAE